MTLKNRFLNLHNNYAYLLVILKFSTVFLLTSAEAVNVPTASGVSIAQIMSVTSDNEDV